MVKVKLNMMMDYHAQVRAIFRSFHIPNEVEACCCHKHA